jgi:hypothetical protein
MVFCPVPVEQGSAEGVIEKLATEWKQLDPDNSACLILMCWRQSSVDYFVWFVYAFSW